MTKFGLPPYRFCLYGERSCADEVSTTRPREVSLLREVLESLKCGFLAEVEKLLPLLTHQSYDIRQYSQQLFAHACNHRHVQHFKGAIEAVSDSSELYRVVVRLGETLSLGAIPLMLSTRATVASTTTN